MNVIAYYFVKKLLFYNNFVLKFEIVDIIFSLILKKSFKKKKNYDRKNYDSKIFLSVCDMVEKVLCYEHGVIFWNSYS